MNKPLFSCRLLIASFTILVACSGAALAQSVLQKSPSAADPQGTSDKEPFVFGNLEDEMRFKRKLKLDQKQYQDNLERAREADKLGVELLESYQKTKALTQDDTKKLERLEKLTRRIRSEAGGSDEDASLDNPPNELQLALSRLAQVTQGMRKVVEKTPRQVVSATVIQQANVVLQLVRITRDLFH